MTFVFFYEPAFGSGVGSNVFASEHLLHKSGPLDSRENYKSPLALAEALTILVRTRSVLRPLPLVALATAVTCLAV
ncbi:hypothetical protein DTO271G3_2770 [Paecilomyces variotii]|nr:hypothetical protein DTO271G3_2770 [Paecilomyces variotii]